MGADQRENQRQRQMVQQRNTQRPPVMGIGAVSQQNRPAPVMGAGMVPQQNTQRPPMGGAAPSALPAVQSMKKGGKVKSRGDGIASKGLTKGKRR